jgi:hypothetical protein
MDGRHTAECHSVGNIFIGSQSMLKMLNTLTK